ncbi:MAG: quinone oxidoreductase [Thermoanaerobaculia bacterium]
MKAIRFHRHGGPEVLRLDDVPSPEPGSGEVRVRLEAVGVNFIDTYLRTGAYPSGPLPAIVGKEGGGVVDAVGPGTGGLAEGDRVAFFGAAGSYAEQVVIPAASAIPVPRDIGLRSAVALTLQGMTAHYLTQTIRPVGGGDRVLIHAAAGGVGLLAIWMAKLFGAEVFGTCSTPEKADRARAAGADHVILYTETDFADEVLRLTGGEGVDLVIDGVGRGTFLGSVRATRVRGHVVLFGQASGEPEPIRPRAVLGSRTLTCASLFDYVRDREEMLARAQAVFTWHRIGKLDVRVDRVLPLAEAAEAHRLLEGRKTSGKLLLEP